MTVLVSVMCPLDFTLENGDYKLIIDDTKVEYHMAMTCKKRYIMKGVPKFTCKNGAWDRIPSQTICYSKLIMTCKHDLQASFKIFYFSVFFILEKCSCLNVQNGNVNCQQYGDFLFATVSCKRGYKLQGSRPAVCHFGSYLTTARCIR